MLGAIKNIINQINVESANLAGSNINGFKKKSSSLGSSGDGLNSIGNDFYTKTDFSQGALEQTGDSAELGIQGDGFFLLFDDSSSASINPTKSLNQLNSEKALVPPVTSGTFTVNGNTVNVNATTDTFDDVLTNIGIATGGTVTAVYDPIQNAVTLTNNSALPGATVSVVSGTSNFLNVAQLDESVTQPGPFNLNYITSADPVGSATENQKLYLTRRGDFNFNSDGFLVNSRGLYVAGLEEGSGRLIKIDKKTFEGGGDADDQINFTADGVLFNETQGTKAGKQLALGKVPNPQALANSTRSSDLYEITSANGILQISTPSKDGLGTVKGQSLELSNASPVDSLTNLGLLQKFFPSTMDALKVQLGVIDDLNATMR